MHRTPSRRSANVEATRRWLSKAMHGHSATWDVDAEGRPLLRPRPPDWALMLHSYELWRFMPYRAVRKVMGSVEIQRTILAADRLGGPAAVAAVVYEQCGLRGRTGDLC